MLTIIHGDDLAASRSKLRELINEQKDFEKVYFDGQKVTLPDLVLACESLPMLFQNRLVVIENLLTIPKSKNKEELISYIKSQSQNMSVILWENKKLEKKTVLSKFEKFKEFPFLLPANLFKFLDCLGIESGKRLVSEFQVLLKVLAAELIFTMIIRQWRNMIVIADGKGLEPEGLAFWQIEKLKRQAVVFGQEKLITLYRQLLSIDYKIKSGLTPLNMRELLDIFLLNI